MKLFTDGGARGNPGPAAAGVVLYNDTQIVDQAGLYLGKTTNNEAEYKALILGLELSLKHTKDVLNVFMDSELVVKQLNKEYRVKQEHLKILYDQVKKIEASFTKVTYTHIKRELNSEADQIVNDVLDSA